MSLTKLRCAALHDERFIADIKPSTHRRRRRESTVELSRVGEVYGIRNQLATVSTNLNKFVKVELRRCERTRPSAVVTQFTISCTVELLRLVTSDNVMTSLLKKVSIVTPK